MTAETAAALKARHMAAGKKAAETKARIKREAIATAKDHHPTRIPELRPLERARGCLVGGAVGDALGAPVEFLSLAQIRSRFGSQGVKQFEEAYGGLGAITDDTQMTFFTAEGLVRAIVRGRERGLSTFEGVTYYAYLRWLHTQGVPWDRIPQCGGELDGWLVDEKVLHHRRAPGNTCLSALGGPMGEPYQRLNNSKGCGGVMRAAPVGLIGRSYGSSFDTGCRIAAITHGHPSGFLAAGYLAMVIAELMEGARLSDALDQTDEVLTQWREHEEVAAAVQRARRAAEGQLPTPENVERLGEGWVAEEALAIAIFCSLTAVDFRSGVLAAVNHGGDSDSTGAITGNILGALWGYNAIPADLAQQIEAREIAETLARDLLEVSAGEGRVQPRQMERYPGW
jgi:ADP-ribosyl-[dinitrogen reductase] hydrolase